MFQSPVLTPEGAKLGSQAGVETLLDQEPVILRIQGGLCTQFYGLPAFVDFFAKPDGCRHFMESSGSVSLVVLAAARPS